jgi:hypothetical protein
LTHLDRVALSAPGAPPALVVSQLHVAYGPGTCAVSGVLDDGAEGGQHPPRERGLVRRHPVEASERVVTDAPRLAQRREQRGHEHERVAIRTTAQSLVLAEALTKAGYTATGMTG